MFFIEIKIFHLLSKKISEKIYYIAFIKIDQNNLITNLLY